VSVKLDCDVDGLVAETHIPIKHLKSHEVESTYIVFSKDSTSDCHA